MYEELGVKIGIELHQQLNGKKLFCDCNCEINEKEILGEIRRRIKTVTGESGETDVAGTYEILRDKEFLYRSYIDESCLVDCDEEPCHYINKDHFNDSLRLALFLKLKIPDYICVMRKNVFDGSVSSGFQRTMIIGLESKDSFIETSKGKVKLEQLNLEEDACKIISKEKGIVIYSLSRQGIPLWELGTDASIKDNEHAKETASIIGMILRSTEEVKRGIGSIRQDINISINEGARVEIKGWQDLRTFKLLIENEILRQKYFINLKKELKDFILEDKMDVTELFKNCNFNIFKNMIDKNAVVLCLKINDFNNKFKEEICCGKLLGKEIAEYAMAYGVKGMIHSDEDLSKYHLEKEFELLKKKLKANNKDLVLVICEQKDICKKAMDAVIERLKNLKKGVLEETRIPNHKDGTSSYARPLPGRNRMYPETDHPLIEIGDLSGLERVKLLEERIYEVVKKYNLSDNLAKEVIENDYEQYLKNDPKFVAYCLIEIPKEIKSRFGLVGLTVEDILIALTKVDIFGKERIIDVLVDFLKNKKFDFNKFKIKDIKEKEIIQIIKENKGASFNAIMGKVLERFKDANIKKVIEIIKKNI